MGMDPFSGLRQDIDRLFEDFFRGSVPAMRGEEGMAMLMPSIDVSETDNAIQVQAELPGVDEQDIDVQLTGDMLTIRGEKKAERKEEERNYRVVERSYGTFERTLRLPFEAEPDKVQASFDKGVLMITVPKPQEQQQKSRKIQLTKGGGESGTAAGGGAKSSAKGGTQAGSAGGARGGQAGG